MRRTSWVSLVIVFVAVSVFAQTYEVIDLGPNVGPAAINNLGQVVGAYNTPPTPTTPPHANPFLWSNGTFNYFAPSEWAGGIAAAITDDGSIIVGQAHLNYLTGQTRPFVRTNGTITYLNGTGPGASLAVNSNGTVGGYFDADFGTYPFISENGLVTILPHYSHGGGVSGINSSGVAVGDLGTATGTDAVVWINHQLTTLPALLPGKSASAWGINDSGQIVGTIDTTELMFPGWYKQHAALWQPDSTGAYTLTDLGGLGGFQNLATHVNAAGQVVGVMMDSTFATYAFKYENGTAEKLDTLAASTGWRFWMAASINDNGDIVGQGVPPGASNPYEFHGFILRVASLTPEQMIAKMIAKIEGDALNAGIARSLEAKLEAVRGSLGKTGPSACNQLAAFTNEVAAQSGKALSDAQVADLLADAAKLAAKLGC